MRARTTTAIALIGTLVVIPDVAPAETRGTTTLAPRMDESRTSAMPFLGAGGTAGMGGMMIAQRDGTPGNPPSAATGRAVDRAQGQTPRPDGTPGNPPGTAAGRAVDRTLGTNTTGASRGGSARDGTPGNPPSTATGRAVDRAQGQTPRPDGTPGNPPGTAAGRATDRALGTNTRGTNPGRTGPSR